MKGSLEGMAAALCMWIRNRVIVAGMSVCLPRLRVLRVSRGDEDHSRRRGQDTEAGARTLESAAVTRTTRGGEDRILRRALVH